MILKRSWWNLEGRESHISELHKLHELPIKRRQFCLKIITFGQLDGFLPFWRRLDISIIEAVFWLGINLKETHLCVSWVEKIHFAFTNDTFHVSTDLKTGSLSVSKDTFIGIEQNLEWQTVVFSLFTTLEGNAKGDPPLITWNCPAAARFKPF